MATIFRQAYPAGHTHASADGVLAAFSSGSHEIPRVVLASVVGSQTWGGAPLIARWCCSPLWNGSGMVGAYQRASRSLAVCLMYRLAVQHASRNANRRKHAAARPDPRQLPFWRPALRLRRLRPACSVGCSPWAWFQIARACPHRAWRRHTRNVGHGGVGPGRQGSQPRGKNRLARVVCFAPRHTPQRGNRDILASRLHFASLIGRVRLKHLLHDRT